MRFFLLSSDRRFTSFVGELLFMYHSLVGFTFRLGAKADSFRASLQNSGLHPATSLDFGQALVAAWSWRWLLVGPISTENSARKLTRRIVHFVDFTGFDRRLLGQWNQSLLCEHPIVLNLPCCLQDRYFGDLLDQCALSDVILTCSVVR